MAITVQITCTFEVTDEVALREAGFMARHKDQALAAIYRESDDTAAAALCVLMQHQLPLSIPGVQLTKSTSSVLPAHPE